MGRFLFVCWVKVMYSQSPMPHDARMQSEQMFGADDPFAGVLGQLRRLYQSGAASRRMFVELVQLVWMVGPVRDSLAYIAVGPIRGGGVFLRYAFRYTRKRSKIVTIRGLPSGEIHFILRGQFTVLTWQDAAAMLAEYVAPL